MDDELKYKKIDEQIEQIKNIFMNRVLSQCNGDSTSTVYALCSMMHDFMRMTYACVRRGSGDAEAKAAFKVILDDFLIQNGMSVEIFEFN